jgi:predicted amidophosphoribosyltransferase
MGVEALRDRLLRWGNLAAHLVWPEHCPSCGRLATPLCPSCAAALLRRSPGVCVLCGKAMEPRGEDGALGCPDHAEGFPCFAGGEHEGALREAILSLKYRGARRTGRILGEALGEALRGALSRADALVPVPLHRNSDRGYNQAALVASGLGGVWGIPVRDCLCWRRDVPRRAGPDSVSRLLPPESIESRESLQGQRLILVDDVRTTGGTLRAAAEALRAAGGIVVGGGARTAAPTTIPRARSGEA